MMIESVDDLTEEVWLTIRRQLLSFWSLDENEEGLIQRSIQIAIDQVKEAYDKSNRIYYKKYGFSVLNTTYMRFFCTI